MQHSATASDPDWTAELAPRRPASRRVQVVLAALVIAAAGFVGGIVTTQQVDQSQQPSGLPDGIELPEGVDLPDGMGFPAGGTPGGGNLPDAGELAALGGGSPTYTVTVVDGDTLYLEDGSGATVKVVTLPTTEVRRLARGRTQDLRPGDTVTVTGDADSSGTILAEAVDQAG